MDEATAGTDAAGAHRGADPGYTSRWGAGVPPRTDPRGGAGAAAQPGAAVAPSDRGRSARDANVDDGGHARLSLVTGRRRRTGGATRTAGGASGCGAPRTSRGDQPLRDRAGRAGGARDGDPGRDRRSSRCALGVRGSRFCRTGGRAVGSRSMGDAGRRGNGEPAHRERLRRSKATRRGPAPRRSGARRLCRPAIRSAGGPACCWRSSSSAQGEYPQCRGGAPDTRADAAGVEPLAATAYRVRAWRASAPFRATGRRWSALHAIVLRTRRRTTADDCPGAPPRRRMPPSA